jgi:hypothetical protein
MHSHRRVERRRSGAVLAAALALSLSVCSCAGPPSRAEALPEGEPPSASRAVPAAPALSETTRVETFAASRGYLIYSVQWGKAEDLALTLEPIVQARYGPAARVVPHVPTNKLFIYLPSPREQDAAGATRGISPAPGAPRAGGIPSPAASSAGRRAPSGGSTR